MVMRPEPPVVAPVRASIFKSPYWAPLTQPFKNIAAFTYTPIRDFVEAVSMGLRGKPRGYFCTKADTPIRQVFVNLFDVGDKFHTSFMAYGGAIIGALSASGLAGVGAFSALAGSGIVAQAGAATIAGIAGAGIGAVAGPFVMAGVVAAAGAIAGVSLGVVPGFVSGTVQAIKASKNTPATAANNTPPAPTAKERFNALYEAYKRVPQADQEFVAETLRTWCMKAAQKSPGERVLDTIDRLPPDEREKLVRGLREKLAAEFGQVAQKDAQEATVLDDKLTVDKPLKVRVRKAAPAARST